LVEKPNPNCFWPNKKAHGGERVQDLKNQAHAKMKFSMGLGEAKNINSSP
jgi:hypothetical protein